LHSGDVFELEGGDVGTAVEEEGLAVAAVLSCSISVSYTDSRETRRMCRS
jgi:hypothetical protein